MARTKGSKNKSTLMRQKSAATLLLDCKQRAAELAAELEEHNERLQAERTAAASLRRKLRDMNKRIAQLELDAAEQQRLERQEADLRQINSIVDTLIASGVSADELLKRLE